MGGAPSVEPSPACPLPIQPSRDCPLCPRLVDFREAQRAAHPDWHNAPVPSFGPLDAPILIVGLAPGLKGANRSGRPFTGDHAGRLLYDTLLLCGLAEGHYDPSGDDDLRLTGARIVNAVRCLPPANKPLPAEVATCRRFLAAEAAAMPNLRVLLALGRIAHDSVLALFGLHPSKWPFAHGAAHTLPEGSGPKGPVLLDSYHCSRQNTNTGRLTPAMFEAVFRTAMERAIHFIVSAETYERR